MPRDGGDRFEPVNDLERALARSLTTGTRAALLRALARSTVCVPANLDSGIVQTDAGSLRVPCVVDVTGRHALVYTSYRQLAAARQEDSRDELPWFEVPASALFERWPEGVDIWLNAGTRAGLPLDPAEISTVAELAAGREVDEAYEVGPEDCVTDFPGPSVPDMVDCAIVVALMDTPEVVEVFRMFRRLEEPQGRTWRIVLVLTDQDAHGERLAQTIAQAMNDASDECCEVHVADVHDDGVYEAVAPIVGIGVSLWRREGFSVPDTIEGIERFDAEPGEPTGGAETGGAGI